MEKSDARDADYEQEEDEEMADADGDIEEEKEKRASAKRKSKGSKGKRKSQGKAAVADAAEAAAAAAEENVGSPGSRPSRARRMSTKAHGRPLCLQQQHYRLTSELRVQRALKAKPSTLTSLRSRRALKQLASKPCPSLSSPSVARRASPVSAVHAKSDYWLTRAALL